MNPHTEIEEDDQEDLFAAFCTDDAAELKEQNKSRIIKTRERQLYSRFSSERNLEEMCEWEFEEGAAYHFLSAGDIDSITFLRLALRQQPLDYLMFSTWCLAKVDVDELRRYLDIGRIKRLDSYVGDFYATSHYDVYVDLKGVHKAHGGRAAITFNHSKTFVGFGPRFDFVVESSANINTNPRAENTVITIDRGLALFYKEYFDGIVSFERNFADWRPYTFNAPTEGQEP